MTEQYCIHEMLDTGEWFCAECLHKCKATNAPKNRICRPLIRKVVQRPSKIAVPVPQNAVPIVRKELPVCIHRKEKLRDQDCKKCQNSLGLLSIEVFGCTLHKECTEYNTSIQPRIRGCSTCTEYKAIAQQIPTAILNTKQNLLYHIYPLKKSDGWKWNVWQLCTRIDRFNGVRSIAIVTDKDTENLKTVQAEFAKYPGATIDNWIVEKNDPMNREGVTFVKLMETLPQDDSITFYAHAKGVSHDDEKPYQWAEIMYESLLDDMGTVRDTLRYKPIIGSFKRQGEFIQLQNNAHWHYSGTFFWFRNRETFSRDWRRLHNGFFACVEAWPANIYSSDEAACIFGCEHGEPGTLVQMEKWWKLWKDKHA